MSWRVMAALILLQALNVADTITTTWAMEMGVRELNPAMAWVIGTFPHMWQFIKIMLVYICGIFLMLVSGSKWVDRMIYIVTLVYAAVVINNVVGLCLVGGL